MTHTTGGRAMDVDTTKLSQVKACIAKGDWKGALRIAAKFPRLGDHRERITRGWAAVQSPDFYRQLGQDPDALFADACAAVRERYEIQ